MEKQENLVRTVLKNEITWLAMLVGTVMAFVYNVVIPINSIQLQLLAIQNQVSDIKSYDARITTNSNDIIVLQQQINQINRLIK